MAKKPRLPVPPVDEEYAAKVMERIHARAHEYRGDFGDLEAALGMMAIGHLVGWRVLVLIHNKRTIKKYEQILDIEVRSEFPEEGPLAAKSLGLELAKKLGSFWKAVSGDVSVEGRREFV